MILPKHKKLFYILILLPVITFLNINCGNKENGKKGSGDPLSVDTVAVKVSLAESKDIKLSKTFTGTLEGQEQANIVAKISERIIEIKAKVGERIKAGQILILLDKSGATSQFYQARAGYLNAEKDYQRMKALFEEGAISQQMLDGTKTAYEIAKANFEAAKSSVELTSPINGVVTAVNPNVGDLSNPGMPLITVASISGMKILFSVGEADLPSFAVGQNAEIYSELKPELIQTGKISQISKSANVSSRSFDVKALFSNTKDNWFKPGMFCRVNVVLQNHKKVLTVPNVSIVNTQGGVSVFTVKNGKAFQRNVKVGLTDGNMTEILTGLSKGENVVTLGMNELKDGRTVRVVE